ncbi:MAG: hypothetical protein KAS66_08345 [Candidatus Omnitrophica bacterium]|nr:hypothetical protein [Candidatus Omnitrophota bacterium]
MPDAAKKVEDDEPLKGDKNSGRDALVVRIGKWEIRIGGGQYTVGYRESPEQRYLYGMAFGSSLKWALKNLSDRMLEDKFIQSEHPDAERDLEWAIEMVENHDEWFSELSMGY